MVAAMGLLMAAMPVAAMRLLMAVASSSGGSAMSAVVGHRGHVQNSFMATR